MLFNSLQFAVFFLVVYSVYLLVGHRAQNRLLLVASNVFYATWDWRFLFLLWISTCMDFLFGRYMERQEDPTKRKRFVVLSVVVNLAFLGIFKYFNFFADNLKSLAGVVGWSLDPVTLKIILPVGISFYTFQSMSYIIDIYRRKMRPVQSLWDYALFVAFFPHMVAGPIMPAKDLLPQVTQPRIVHWQKFREGCWLFFWGLFIKVFVADNLGHIVDRVFRQTGTLCGSEVMLAVFAFAIQIYGDFAGYSEMARGLAKMMGFELMINFRFPYFVTNPSDFWKNWHISLSSWLRDYLYIPLGGNRRGEIMIYRNLAVTMLLGGLWHGAAWTYVLWGTYQGLILCLHRLLATRWRVRLPTGAWMHALKVVFMLQVTCLGWLIFRAQSVKQVGQMLASICLNPGFGSVAAHAMAWKILFFVWPILLMQWAQLRSGDLMFILRQPTAVRWAVYLVTYYLLVLFGEFGGKQFIYFQF